MKKWRQQQMEDFFIYFSAKESTKKSIGDAIR